MVTNFQRLIRLAEETFDARHDPEQLSMTDHDWQQLRRLHPSTVSEYTDAGGPVAWILLFPTTHELMDRFLREEIGEQELLHQTPPGIRYDTVYLCSALVLEEYRRQGIAGRLAHEALENIRRDHPVETIFIWAFTTAGDRLAASIAGAAGLELRKRPRREHP